MKLFRHDNPVHDETVDGVRIQVVDRGEQRELRFGNHITQSARSLVAPQVLVLDYTRAMMAGLLFVPRPETVLHLGLGGGSLPEHLHRHLPDVRQRVAEVNAGVIDAAYRYFELPVSERLQVIQQDGAEFLQQDVQHYALIFLDAFLAGGAAPHMNTGTVFRMLRERLEPAGRLVVNTWGSDRENLARVRATLIDLFEQVHQVSVRAESNVIFVAAPHGTAPSQAQLRRRVQWLSQRFPMDFDALLARVQPLRSRPGAPPVLSDATA